MSFSVVLFALVAAVTLATGVLTVLSRNPVRSALFLVLNLLSVGALYLLLNAYFLATVQVIVYAGAIMVLFLFVIMLLNLGTPDQATDRLRLQQPLAVGAGALLAGMVGWAIFAAVPAAPAGPPIIAGGMAIDQRVKLVTGDAMGTVEGIGKTLYEPTLPWLLPFEITSILLLVAVIGSVVLAKRSAGGESADGGRGGEPE